MDTNMDAQEVRPLAITNHHLRYLEMSEKDLRLPEITPSFEKHSLH